MFNMIPYPNLTSSENVELTNLIILLLDEDDHHGQSNFENLYILIQKINNEHENDGPLEQWVKSVACLYQDDFPHIPWSCVNNMGCSGDCPGGYV